ncbi:TonB-dependent receptor [Kineobactrum salinum]|uniref:TonB-dependent receptor n=1 Tax=Kineobactrum salinum TaxID=2708301 RepID=A0A6C0TX86_9GAMM|nr:TonB-dependent receptor [Kineobactrum salinum]QIB64133.1 TonB-dependent receptor [Kineobactrum salinum]
MNKQWQRKLIWSGISGAAAVLPAVVVSGATALWSGAVTAQEEANRLMIEEVVVTSRRREESLQDVPVSITAFSADSIERNMFKGIEGYFSRTPNVSFISTGSRDRKELSIRGVTNQLDTTEALVRASTFAFYLDDVNVVSATANPGVMDLERIEVLRGPQGTYFGRNAVGGAVNISTVKPDHDFFAQVSGELGRYDTRDIEGVINMPVIDDVLAVRANYKYYESDGHIKNINPIGGGNNSEYEYGRLSARYTPSDRLTVDLMATTSDEVVGMREGVPSGVMSVFAASLFGNVADPDGVGFYPDNRNRVNFDRPQDVGSKWELYTGKFEYDFDAFSLVGITGYIESDTFLRGDIDGSSQDFVYEEKPISRESISQEFRLQSAGNERLDWTVGVIYSKDKGDIIQQTFAGAGGLFGLPEDFQITSTVGDNESRSAAVFGELTWHFNDRLDLVFGGRYTKDEVEVSQYRLSSGVINGFVEDEADFTDFSPKVSVNYALGEDMDVFATVSKGFKAGGVQLGSDFERADFDPEELWNYELGFKSQLMDRRLRLNGSLFYLEWDDLQASFAVAETNDQGVIVFNSGIQNAASASNLGGELEISAVLTENLVVNFSAGYVDAEFDDFTNAFVDGELYDLSGQAMPNAPEWTFSGDAEYRFTFADRYDSFVRLEWFHRDEILPDLVALVRQDEGFPFRVPSYDHFNLRAGIETDRFSVTAYVENLFDEEYFTNAYQKAFLGGLHVQPSYQTWGVRVTLRTL